MAATHTIKEHQFTGQPVTPAVRKDVALGLLLWRGQLGIREPELLAIHQPYPSL